MYSLHWELLEVADISPSLLNSFFMVVEVVAVQLVMQDTKLEVVVTASWVMAASEMTFLEQGCQGLLAGRLEFLLPEEPGYVA